MKKLTRTDRAQIKKLRADIDAAEAWIERLDWLAPHRARLASLKARLAAVEQSA